MAVWQYKVFLIPKSEIDSFFEKESNIRVEDLNGINWWKYSDLGIQAFNALDKILPRKKSWSEDIILFGDESSNCLEVMTEGEKVTEVSARFDLRCDYSLFLKSLCEFAVGHRLLFLNDSLKIIEPDASLLEADIQSYPVYKSFLDKLK